MKKKVFGEERVWRKVGGREKRRGLMIFVIDWRRIVKCQFIPGRAEMED
jgi:hypothetical protein